ncbi:MAG TPA: TIR-like protein FxsC [Actinocrinis sp.]|nr:TIR-like protein FxsC [Actinocrinis sp.]
MLSGHEPTTEPDPYFFLSYAHSHGLTSADDFRGDRLVKRFHDDLREHVQYAAHGTGGTIASAVDLEIPIGGHWPERISKGLARCRSFVALYSTTYFSSEHCGKEWKTFANRLVSDHAMHGRRPEAIIPVLWQPIRDDQLPKCASPLQYSRIDLTPTYRDKGLNYLLRHMLEYRDEYEEAVTHLAAQIVFVAENGYPTAIPHSFDYRDMEDAFQQVGDPTVPRPRMRIVIAAPCESDLPRDCAAEMYGRKPLHWRPFLPEFPGEIAITAQRLAESMDFQAFVEALEHSSELSADTEPSAPTILIVDPWAAQVPALQERLSTFDRNSRHKLWIRPVIVWNRDHPASTRNEGDLERELFTTLPLCRKRYRPDSPQVLDGLQTVQDFIRELPTVIRTAERLYFSEVARSRPDAPEELPPRPRFKGPGPGLGSGGLAVRRDMPDPPDGESDQGFDDDREQR